jgi:hypothetical protein
MNQDSPFGNLQGTFGQSTPKQNAGGVDYHHPQEEKVRQAIQTSLSQTPTGQELLESASTHKIGLRIIKGKASSGFVPEAKAVYIGLAPELSTPNPETILDAAAYLRQAQLQFLGKKNPDESMTSNEKALAFDTKMLDSLVTLCKITAEHYENGHTEFVDAMLRMGHGELYESFRRDGQGPELKELFYKLYIVT